MSRAFSRVGIAERLFHASLIVVGVIGLFTPGWYNLLPSNFVFEGILFACAVIMFGTPKRSIAPFFVGSILYVSISFFLMVQFRPSNYLDFAQVFKAFIYIAPLCLFYKRGVFERESALKLLKFLLLIFFAKYLYSVILNVNPRMGSRPAIYVENNFELIFLMLFFYAMRLDLGRSLNAWFALLVSIIVLSGSRSSILALLVLFFGLYVRTLSLRTFFYLIGFGVLAVAAAAIFALRSKGGGIESIDRYKFMLVFLYEVRDWPIWKFFVGHFPITALSPESCSTLSFYERLYSFADNDSCYSVILHSYFLRVILDHGLLGLVFLFGFIYRAMIGSGYSRMDVITVMGVISASALSVSAMNSVFVSLALALILGLKRRIESTGVDRVQPAWRVSGRA